MQSKIEQRVMASVGAVYALRQLVSASAVKLYICLAAAYVLAQLVWVHRIFENLSQVGLGHAAQFFLVAVLNTNFLVQATLLVLAVAGWSFVRDLMSSSRPAFSQFA